MIEIKTREEIAHMRAAGLIAAKARQAVGQAPLILKNMHTTKRYGIRNARSFRSVTVFVSDMSADLQSRKIMHI